MDLLVEYLKNEAMKSHVIFKHASALFCNKNVYSIGINKYIFNKKLNYFSTIHSEISAINILKNTKINKLDILIIRIDKNKKLQMSKPCQHCLLKLKLKNIRNVYYSDGSSIICEKLNEMTTNHISSSEKFKAKLSCV